MKSIVRHGRGSARTLPSHQDQGLEIIYLEKGALNWHVAGRVERVTAGAVYFSLPWQEHGSADEFEPGHYWYWAQLGLAGDIARPRRSFGFHADFGLKKKEAREISLLLASRGRHCYRATPRMAWILRVLLEELENPDEDRTYLATLGRLSILELARCIWADEGEVAERSGSERKVAAFIAGLSDRCDETWTLEEMAKACGLGRSRFALLCKKISGDSPLTLVNRLRVDRAKEPLKRHDDSVTELALACGFSSSQYFARVFKGFTGLDARSYRRKHASKPQPGGQVI